jgi:hypothetical protein
MPGLGLPQAHAVRAMPIKAGRVTAGKSRRIAEGGTNADSNLPQVQNGMCDEPRVRPTRVSYREGNLMSGDLLTVSEGDSSEIRR